MRVCVVINPQAGRGRAGRRAARVWALLRPWFRHLEMAVSRSAGHLTELAREAVSAGYDVVVGCGGDGTVHHLLAPLSRSATLLGVIPLGSGNDLARSLGLPMDYRAACGILARGRIRRLDLARVGERFFATVASVGMSAEVARRANASRMPGRWRYLWASAWVIPFSSPHRLRVRMDGEDVTDDILLLAVGNGAFFGGGFKILPEAELDDGVLDLCMVRSLGRLQRLRALPSVYRGAHRDHPAVSFYRARHVEIHSPSPLDLFADGELLRQTPVTIEVVPAGVNVLVP